MFTSINCYTLFDITDTGIRSHIRAAQFPMKDKHGNVINNEKEWIRARNQQRNCETILQIISLRSQPLRIIGPRKVDVNWKTENKKINAWKFNFEVEHASVFYSKNNELGALVDDATGVPMLTGLNESIELAPYLVTSGNLLNIYFEIAE